MGNMKTPENVRNQIVQLRREGKSYSEIQRAVNVSSPTVAGVLSEAGLTRKRSAAAAAVQASAQAGLSSSPVSNSSSESKTRQANGDGVSHLQPEPKKVKPDRVDHAPRGNGETQHVQCDGCGTVFAYSDESEVPGSCPECGA